MLFSFTSNKKIFFVAGVVALLLVLWLFSGKSTHEIPVAFRVGESTITLERAETEYARQQGLSGREGLQTDTGMLFVFEEPGQYPFWMRDMRFSIDIVWLDEQFTVVHVENDVAPETYPELFAPTRDALYVLELPAGEAGMRNIEEGTTLQPVFK